MNITPAAASHRAIRDGGRTYLFFLREDACWSDGRPVTAQDFVYTWKRALIQFLYGWVADYPDPDNFLCVSPVWRRTHWQNPLYAAPVEQARHITSQEERLQMYRRADRLLIEEAVVLPLTYGQIHLLVKPWVKRLPISPLLLWYWKDAVIEAHGEG